VAQPVRRPRSVLYAVKRPEGSGPDLLVFLGEAQPPNHGWAFANALLDLVAQHGVKRVVTFAAMAALVEPETPSKVYAVATKPEVLSAIPKDVVEPLEDGAVSGLNGVLLGAAAARKMDGLCLLGQFPTFAAQLPNPKASAAVLRAFSKISGVPVDLAPLDTQAAEMDRHLSQLWKRLKAEAAKVSGERPPEEAEHESFLPEPEDEEPEKPKDRLTPEQRTRLDRLFEEVGRDRGKAVVLKAELDRLGVFREFEDRFLDLFKRGE
jgi:proteasome assembly chaperone (PAC2) family protein